MTKLVSMAFLYYHIKSIISHNIYSFHADVLDDNSEIFDFNTYLILISLIS